MAIFGQATGKSTAKSEKHQGVTGFEYYIPSLSQHRKIVNCL
jgi:hypothetical protein